MKNFVEDLMKTVKEGLGYWEMGTHYDDNDEYHEGIYYLFEERCEDYNPLKEIVFPRFGTWIMVDSWNQGSGNEMGYVIHFTDSDTYIKFCGTYDSWNDNYFDEEIPTVVEPHRKVSYKWSTTPQSQEDLKIEIEKMSKHLV